VVFPLLFAMSGETEGQRCRELWWRERLGRARTHHIAFYPARFCSDAKSSPRSRVHFTCSTECVEEFLNLIFKFLNWIDFIIEYRVSVIYLE
jgi:hypothetical protein